GSALKKRWGAGPPQTLIDPSPRRNAPPKIPPPLLPRHHPYKLTNNINTPKIKKKKNKTP
ncbi:hypothetical protein, partial [Enterobacter asburiae]